MRRISKLVVVVMIMIVIALCLLTMTACSITVAKGGTLLKEGPVRKISVSSRPEGHSYSFTGDRAQSIIDYISQLHLIDDYPENPGDYDGMTWVISLEYEDGTILTIYHFGNMFIKAENGPWYKMTYEEASRFDTLVS